MKRSTPAALFAAILALPSSSDLVASFAPTTTTKTTVTTSHASASERLPRRRRTTTTTTTTTATTTTSLDLWPAAMSASSSVLISTIDSDIASIPNDEFRTVFAGGIAIMFGSILSTMFVGFLIESNGGGYADLVAETYAGQNMGDGEETFLNSLGLNAKQKTETADMVRAFREKKMRKAGTWTTEDEDEKRRLAEEKDMFSDYD